MSTQITTQKILAFDEYADFPSTGVEGFIYIDNSVNIGYLWDSVANTYVNIGGEPEPIIPPDPIPLLFVNAATGGVITPVPNYTNGVAGVGAKLIGGVNGVLTDGTAPGRIDFSYIPTAGDIILVKDQTVSTTLSSNKAFQNGVYLIVNPGSSTSQYELLRLPDYDTSTGLYPLQVNATGGTNNVTRYYIQTTVNPVIGTNNATGNLIFPLTTGQSVSAPIAFVDTVIDTTLPTSVYANGTAFPTVPGNGATLTATAFGPLGTHNGLTATIDNNSVTGFRRALVINQPNAAYNGDYVVIRPGSIYTSAAGATSTGTTINVTSVAGLVVGMTVTVLSGTGAFAANTTVTSINIPLNRFVVSIAPTTPLSGGATVVRAGTTWQLRRLQTGAGGFDRYSRFFMVSNTGSTKAGKYYFTTPNATPLTNDSSLPPFNTGIGIAPINIVEYGGTSTGKVGVLNTSGGYTFYNTLGAAMAAASNGSTIEFFASTTETATVTIKPEITILGNGFICTLAGNSNISTLFIDSTGGVDYSYRIYNLRVIRGSGTANTDAHTLLISASATGKRKIYCDGSLFSNSINGSNAINCQSSDASVSIYNAKASSSIAAQFGIYVETVNLYNCHSEGAGIGIQNNGVSVNCVGISSNNFGLLIREGINCTGISSFTYGIKSFGSGILNGCTAVSSASSAWYVLGISIINNCTARSIAGYGFESGGSLSSINNSLSYSSNTSGAFFYGEINNSTFISDTDVGLYYLGSVSNSKISNCAIISKLNSSSGHALRIHTSTANLNPLIKGCSLIAGNASANCIFASGAVTIKYVNNSFAVSTTPINANITQGMVNTQDNQGNILI